MTRSWSLTSEPSPVRVHTTPRPFPQLQTGLPLGQIRTKLTHAGTLRLPDQKAPVILDRRTSQVRRKLALRQAPTDCVIAAPKV